MSLHDEILEQPEAARRQLASSSTALETLAARLRSRPVASVVIAARGTSDHAAIYAQYVLGFRNGLSVGLATPSLVSIYGAPFAGSSRANDSGGANEKVTESATARASVGLVQRPERERRDILHEHAVA